MGRVAARLGVVTEKGCWQLGGPSSRVLAIKRTQHFSTSIASQPPNHTAAMAPSFNPATPAGLKECEAYFLTRSYVTGRVPA